MLRKVAFNGARHHGGKLAPLFLLLGILMLWGLPSFKTVVIKIDENAVGQMYPQFSIDPIDAYLDPTVRQPTRLVRGRRSPGSEIVAVYVNADYEDSVRVANALIEVVRKRDNLACDVQFYFVKSTEEWPVPQSYTRSAIVLNVSVMHNQYLCFDTLGSNGIQPNQDLPNLAVHHAHMLHFIVTYLCQKPGNSRRGLVFPLWHYWEYMEASVQLSLQPQPWHQLPTHSINTLTISSDPLFNTVPPPPRGKVPHKLVDLLLHIIVSLNGLEEKFHHSTFVWLPTAMRRYVEYDAAQFCIVLFVASIFSNAYAEYQRRGITITPLFVGLLLSSVAAAAGRDVAGWPGVAAASALSAGVFRLVMRDATSGMWMSFNAIALCLLIILQPECGLVAGCAAAIQVSFIHPVLQNRPAMLVGAAVSWAFCYYFVHYLHMPLLGFASISELFVSFVIYPNAVWISSRLMCLLL